MQLRHLVKNKCVVNYFLKYYEKSGNYYKLHVLVS